MISEHDEKNGTMSGWQERTGGKRHALMIPPHRALVLDRAMHGAVVRVHGADGSVPSRAIQDIREWRARPWRTLAKRFMEMRAAHVALEDALMVLDTFRQWVTSLWRGDSAA